MNKLIYSVLVAFIISFAIAPLIIPVLHKLKFGQNIREDGPQSHLKKQGTPTMGGIIFIISTCITMILMVRNPHDEAMLALYALIAFGAIGFLDDALKIIKKKNEGLKSYQKMLLLVIVSIVFGYYAKDKIGTDIIIIGTVTWDLKVLFIPFIVVYFAAATNAVNLTDGLDGLCSSITLLIMTFFALVSYGMGYYTLAIFCGILAGAILGFLKYNSYPAQVFMGDGGSLALGGAVAAIAMILKLEFILFLVGGIYVLETLSVIIQVTSFKLTGKRVFKMAPLHHHFELKGWHESKIVTVFSIITVILCLIGFRALTY
ncbi:phospho-N-acetylmuramoyl-pentapeptide-transferase [uncultured Clostridium sp.]|uniref:phospho-N-acetylmuramoyl-pentapeptide- transferase n=1 Tax=uncultured Clostridium sp. TaxID=59620 RepID=UPI003216231E